MTVLLEFLLLFTLLEFVQSPQPLAFPHHGEGVDFIHGIKWICGPTVSVTSTRHTISLGKDEEKDPDHASYNQTKTVLSTRIGVSQITSHVQKNRYAKTGPA